jgi:hypothetical protein
LLEEIRDLLKKWNLGNEIFSFHVKTNVWFYSIMIKKVKLCMNYLKS